eukprot:TRINITY_DN9305_c0_g3_i2.p1 TRINITY_DN9305_c0_g3~~TRINITY_DN9305_c0_g3_i2.p1  ORF type:complete len:373 (-),score=15.34 TRINITY_DN9305_c0_g3_i2:47-1066(-)
MELTCIPSEIFLHQDMLDEVTCSIGTGVMNDPVVLPCTHRFCRKCIEDWLDRHPVCPTCRKPAKKSELKPDEGVWKIICSFKVKCNNPSCAWQGKYSDRDMHIKKYCDYTLIQCDYGCGSKMLRKELPAHLKVCEFAPVPCPSCGISVQKARMAEHKQECPCLTVECPNKCGKSIPQGQLKSHFEMECSEIVQTCKYHLSGCKYTGKRKDIEEHYKDTMEKHLEQTHTTLINIMERLQVIEKNQEKMMQRKSELEQENKERPPLPVNPAIGMSSVRFPSNPWMSQAAPPRFYPMARVPEPNMPKVKDKDYKNKCKPQQCSARAIYLIPIAFNQYRQVSL